MKKITCLLALILSASVFAGPAAAAVPARKPDRPESLVPVGRTAGIQLTARGIIVAGVAEKDPAQRDGLQSGDLITHIDGKSVSGAERFQALIQDSGGAEMEFSVIRRGVPISIFVMPKRDGSIYKVGALVRDNVSGIGTLTFYDPVSHVFGALGHGINDGGMKFPLPLESGILLDAKVTEVRKGSPGQPGELKGMFSSEPSGALLLNSPNGLFGILEETEPYAADATLPLARNSEVRVGEAHILANIKDRAVERFSIEIVRIMDVTRADSRSFMIRITDSDLIERTGGIVQGMSGSPIIQNGRLVGAVTHVLVSDPKRGYGIFIDNMLDEVYGTVEKNRSYMIVTGSVSNARTSSKHRSAAAMLRLRPLFFNMAAIIPSSDDSS